MERLTLHQMHYVLSREGHISSIESPLVLGIEGVGLAEMQGKHAESAKFSTQWLHALESQGPCSYMIQDGWLFYKKKMCVLKSHRPQ